MNYIGYAATVLTISAFVPQTYKVLKTRHTKDLALSTYILLAVVSALWTTFGVGIHSPEIYITNSVVGFLAIIICLVKLKEG